MATMHSTYIIAVLYYARVAEGEAAHLVLKFRDETAGPQLRNHLAAKLWTASFFP